jgi:hypothetical protein
VDQARKISPWCDEVVSARLGEAKKFVVDDAADEVTAAVFRMRSAFSVAKVASGGI